MIKGTTPTIRWHLGSIPQSIIETAEMSLKCTNGKIIVKDLKDAKWQDNRLCWTLTQADTLALTETVYVQLRFRTTTGYAGASKDQKMIVGDILKGGEI